VTGRRRTSRGILRMYRAMSNVFLFVFLFFFFVLEYIFSPDPSCAILFFSTDLNSKESTVCGHHYVFLYRFDSRVSASGSCLTISGGASEGCTSYRTIAGPKAAAWARRTFGARRGIRMDVTVADE
jgi:hypothetical protein